MEVGYLVLGVLEMWILCCRYLKSVLTGLGSGGMLMFSVV